MRVLGGSGVHLDCRAGSVRSFVVMGVQSHGECLRCPFRGVGVRVRDYAWDWSVRSSAMARHKRSRDARNFSTWEL